MPSSLLRETLIFEFLVDIFKRYLIISEPEMDVQRIACLLEASLDPKQNKQGMSSFSTCSESALRQEEEKPQFSIGLLEIVSAESHSNTTRLASALCFKNFVKRQWTDEDGRHVLPKDEVALIKSRLIGLMVSVPQTIQSQLGDAIGVIADSDFWEQWDTLIDDLVSRLTTDNTTINNGVLQVAHSIFKRWRPLYRSDTLFTEVNHVLEKFGTPFLLLFQNTDTAIEANRGNATTLPKLMTTLNLLMKLLYDLSCQDFPPIVEDHLEPITGLLQKYLTFTDGVLENDDEAGSLEFAKSSIFEVLSLFAQKYDDAFGPYNARFVESSWNLLTTIGPETKYDILVSKALQFLTSVIKSPQHAAPFNDEALLGQVVERVILPNLSLRESDLELFEDEPIEFIRRDLEGSDNDTRRRAATDFLRGLMVQYERLVTDVVFRYINHYLDEYAKNPQNQWKSKDTAVYLFSSIAATGTVTASQGIKTTNPNVDVLDFFQNNIASDLLSKDSAHPILQVDAIKYLYIFRSQINRYQWQNAFPLLVKHLASSNYVVYTYAAIAVERILALTDDNRQALLGKAEVSPLAKDLLNHLFMLIEKDQGQDLKMQAAKVQENEFLMRCIMRVLIVTADEMVPLAESTSQHLVGILQTLCINPSNPRFYYYFFEALGAVVRFCVPSQPEKIDSYFFPTLQQIINNDVSEFIPYALQLFAAILEGKPSVGLPDYYKPLVPSLLLRDLWLTKGNTPALTRLLTAIISKDAAELVQTNQIEPILGIFKQLLSTKANEPYAFDLLDSVLTHVPNTALQVYYISILQMMLTKLQTQKTEAFSSRFVRLYHFISARKEQGLGADFFIAIADAIQEGIYVDLYLHIILPETAKLARPLDRKIAVISLTNTLTDSQAFAETYKKGWGFTCDALIKLLQNPPQIAATDELIVDHDVDDMAFGVGFTPLTTIRKPTNDPFPEVRDAKAWAGESLRESARVSQFAQERLTPDVQRVLAGYVRG